MLDDREFFQYTGMAILKGQVPYRDFFDHKPPLIYFINAAGLGLGIGRWGVWLISTGLALAATFLLFRLAKQYRLHYPWLLPLLFNLMIRDFLISERINLTREYSTFFVLFFFCVLMGKHRFRYFLLGVFTALTFFTQQDQVLLLLPFLLYALSSRDTVSVLRRIVRSGAGFTSVAALLILYFALHGSLAYFWEDAYVFNLTVYLREYKSMGAHFRTIKRVLDGGNYEIPFMVQLILGVISLLLRNKKKGLVLAALMAMVLSMSSELMGGRLEGTNIPVDFLVYFLPLSATVCIVLFVVFAFTEDEIVRGRQVMAFYALLLCSSLCYTALQHAASLQRRDSQEVMKRPELPYLRQQQLGDYQLYVTFDGEYTYFYNELKILSPSRWVYQHLWKWYGQWDADHKTMESIAGDLLRHRTLYVIMDPAKLAEVINPVNRDWWMSFMQAHYQPVSVPGREHPILWKLKEDIK